MGLAAPGGSRPVLAKGTWCVASAAVKLGAVLALATGLVAQGQSSTKTGEFFEVTCVGGDDRVATLALAVVEPVWSMTCAAFGVRGLKPEQPLSVTIYVDVDDYLRADRKLTGGRFQPNQAMSHWSSKSAHVAMQPPVSEQYLKDQGLPMQTRAMLAWEACHVARFALCANFRAHPGWFQDGLAAAVAGDVLREASPMAGEQPFFTQRWWRVRRLAERDRVPRVEQLLRDRTDGLGMRDRYAVRLSFFDFVRRTYPARMVRLAKLIRATGVGTAYAEKVREAAVRELGALDEEFRAAALKAEPRWDERSRSLWCDGSTWYQAAFPRTDAVAFRAEPVAGGSFEAKGSVWIRPGASQQMEFLFARTEVGYYSLAIIAGVGFTLLDCRGDGKERRVVGGGKAGGCRAGADVPFSVTGKGKDLSVSLAGQTWRFELPQPLPDKVYWGVGSQAGKDGAAIGSCGVWREVTVSGN